MVVLRKRQRLFYLFWPWRELRGTHSTSYQPNWLGGVCFCPTACSYLWQRNTRFLLQKTGTAFCFHRYYQGSPTAYAAFTLSLHVNEKAPCPCLTRLCKILVAFIRAELWHVFQHCNPLVKQGNHITFAFLLHIQHPAKAVSQSQLVAGASLFN